MSGFSFEEQRQNIENAITSAVRDALVEASECKRPLTFWPFYDGKPVEDGLSLSLTLEFAYSGHLGSETVEAFSGVISTFTVSEMMSTSSGRQFFVLRFPMKDNVSYQVSSASMDCERTFICWDLQLS